ncbi:hypothetical protein C8Q80DRAFT_519667 [Daedaleopsis nitida]|nr:hypothetical protein C8Q80DRAFT_519667 [Daedaleopsis nitida]
MPTLNAVSVLTLRGLPPSNSSMMSSLNAVQQPVCHPSPASLRLGVCFCFHEPGVDISRTTRLSRRRVLQTQYSLSLDPEALQVHQSCSMHYWESTANGVAMRLSSFSLSHTVRPPLDDIHRIPSIAACSVTLLVMRHTHPTRTTAAVTARTSPSDSRSLSARRFRVETRRAHYCRRCIACVRAPARVRSRRGTQIPSRN